MPSLRAEGLSFAYTDAAPVLSAADLHLPAGWTGLVGENGAGKTTLLRLLAGELAPGAGRVWADPAGARVAHCPQDVEVPRADLARLAERGDRDAIRLRAALALDPAALGRWATLSPGERRRWQIGAALAAEPDVLLLDEPTNHADAEARAVLLRALRRFRGVGVVVSHDRALLEALTARTVEIGRGALRVWPGPYGAARAAWEAERAAVLDARSRAQEERRRAEARLGDARRERARADAARSGRGRDPRDRDARSLVANTRRDWAEGRLGRRVAILRREAARAADAVPEAPADRGIGRSVFLGYERAPRPVLLELSAGRVEAGGRPLLRDVSVRLGREDRVRLEGPNGAGKTTLLSALLAAATLPAGRVLHLPQELAPGEGIALLDEVRASPPEVRGRALALVAALGTDPDRLLASRSPSPGEARKMRLALGLGRHAWAVVLDEPTNHLDLPSVERLEEALAAYPGAILLVTHDDAFAARCTASRWRISGGRVEIARGAGPP